MSEMHAYALEKAARGEQVPGHKYKSRKRVGNKWVYTYAEPPVKAKADFDWGEDDDEESDAGHDEAVWRRRRQVVGLLGFGKNQRRISNIETQEKLIDAIKLSTSEVDAVNAWVSNAGEIRLGWRKGVSKAITRAIEKAEAVPGRRPGTLFRGMVVGTDKLAAIEKSGWFADSALSSWTADPYMALGYAAGDDSGVHAQLVLKVTSARGLPIGAISDVPNEEETIMPPVKLRIRKVRRARGFWLLELEESA